MEMYTNLRLSDPNLKGQLDLLNPANDRDAQAAARMLHKEVD
jgi:hypothetical protein